MFLKKKKEQLGLSDFAESLPSVQGVGSSYTMIPETA